MIRKGRRAATVKAFGCGCVIVVISVTPVSVGQARIAQAPARADSVHGSALAPVTFTYTGKEQTYTVPAGVTSLEVQAVGANGGATQSGVTGPPGGTGGMVIGELGVGAGSAVKPGGTLYVEVGSTPTGSDGGFNGGGDGDGVSNAGGGGGGGGASDLRTCSRTAASCQNGVPSPLTRLIVTDASFALGDGTPRVVITPEPAWAIQITRIFYNSPGPDTGSNTSVNAEFVRLTNTGRTDRQLRGWWITDADGNVYRFGRLSLRRGASVTVHSGHGRDTPSNRYWNRRGYIWDNTRELARFYSANGTLADQCRYNDAHHNQLDAEPLPELKRRTTRLDAALRTICRRASAHNHPSSARSSKPARGCHLFRPR